MDVYSRDEMLQMQGAIHDGDYDTLSSLDPTAQDLSPDEFEALRQMYRGEAGSMEDAEHDTQAMPPTEVTGTGASDTAQKGSLFETIRSYLPW